MDSGWRRSRRTRARLRRFALVSCSAAGNTASRNASRPAVGTSLSWSMIVCACRAEMRPASSDASTAGASFTRRSASLVARWMVRSGVRVAIARAAQVDRRESAWRSAGGKIGRNRDVCEGVCVSGRAGEQPGLLGVQSRTAPLDVRVVVRELREARGALVARADRGGGGLGHGHSPPWTTDIPDAESPRLWKFLVCPSTSSGTGEGRPDWRGFPYALRQAQGPDGCRWFFDAVRKRPTGAAR